jgi:hypothetical protein
MGATMWHYFVPYQEDVTQALEDLQAEVFRSGAYQKPFALQESGEEPETLDQMRQFMDENGTHSILDFYQVSETPEFASVSPLSTEEVTKIFGTSMPDKTMLLKAVESDSFDYIPRWHCIYLSSFNADGAPSELLFYGASGD